MQKAGQKLGAMLLLGWKLGSSVGSEVKLGAPLGEHCPMGASTQLSPVFILSSSIRTQSVQLRNAEQSTHSELIRASVHAKLPQKTSLAWISVSAPAPPQASKESHVTVSGKNPTLNEPNSLNLPILLAKQAPEPLQFTVVTFNMALDVQPKGPQSTLSQFRMNAKEH